MVYKDAFEVTHPHFISSTSSTRFFGKSDLKEHKISDSMTVYYSADKDDCIQWLEDRRQMLLSSAEFCYNQLKKAEIKEVGEETPARPYGMGM